MLLPHFGIVINAIGTTPTAATTTPDEVALEAVAIPQSSVTTLSKTEELKQLHPGDESHPNSKYYTTNIYSQRSTSIVTDPPPAPARLWVENPDSIDYEKVNEILES